MNKKAGARLPQMATIENETKSFLKLIALKARIPKGNKTRLAKRMRMVATWFEENVASPSVLYIAFFISMNELPHITESKIRSVQYLS